MQYSPSYCCNICHLSEGHEFYFAIPSFIYEFKFNINLFFIFAKSNSNSSLLGSLRLTDKTVSLLDKGLLLCIHFHALQNCENFTLD